MRTLWLPPWSNRGTMHAVTAHPGGLTRDHVVWAYRLLLDRDPESEDDIGPKLAGSHIGFFTMQMASLVGPGGRVYAFEPCDTNAELLERSIRENHFEDRIVFQRAALGAASGAAVLTFAVDTLNTGGAYLLRDGTAALAGNVARKVAVVALDEAHLARPVRFIKLDVEGAEPLVLEGAERILARDRPLILSELHPAQLQRALGIGVDEYLALIRGM